MNLKVVFMGTPEFAVPILEVLIKNCEVLLVVSQPDKEKGRKKILTCSPIKECALKNKIPVFTPVSIKKDYEMIKELKPDLIVTCAYGQILPKDLLLIPRLGAINVHASLLPKYRGGAPIQHAIMNNEEKSGITIMYMDEGMDSGDIISQHEIKLDKKETSASLHDKLSKLGAEALAKELPKIAKKENMRIKQDSSLVTFAKVIKREDEHLDFLKTAQEIDCQVRALYSWPLANMIIDQEEIKVLEGYLSQTKATKPGVILDIKKDAIGVGTQDYIYYVTKIKRAGKKEMSVKDYLNGQKKEDLLGKIVG